MVCHDLMRDCKINVVDAKIENYSKYGSTFLAKRFDRDKNKRIHFSSAMNLLGKHDNDADVGYLDIVSFIRSSGSHPNKDLLELYKRLAFNMLVRNTDGHLRNHGFLMNKHGWRLSPAYDVNPTPYGDQLSLCVTENSRLINYQSAVKVAGYYGIEKNQAIDIFKTQRNIIMEN